MNIRHVTAADSENVGRIIYQAFSGIADRHNFPYDFPTPESAFGFAEMAIGNPNISGFVAEENGNFLGSNFLWKQDSIAGVGPITVDTQKQSKGVGRKLMEAVIEDGKHSAGIRLVQDAFNIVSMPLYAGLGFDVVEPLVLMEGTPAPGASPSTLVRPFAADDLMACGELSRRVHGFDRNNELNQTSGIFSSFVAIRENQLVAYASAPSMWQLNHAVAESVDDMTSLLTGAARISGKPLSFLLPSRQSELFRWCLKNGMRVVKPMTLMAMGDYRQPQGSFLPSVLF